MAAKEEEPQMNYVERTHICDACKEECDGDNCKLAQSISTQPATKEL